MNNLKCILFSIVLLWAAPSFAATYYVDNSTSSTDWVTCTNISTPCTPATAMANAIADDIVYFRGGIFEPGTTVDEHCALEPANSGSNGSPITFQAYPGETPVINGIASGCSFGATIGSDWIIWDGFSGTALHTGDVQQLFMFYLSNNSIVRNMTLTGYSETNGATNNMIMRFEQGDGCKGYNNTLSDMGGTAPNTNTTGIWVFESTNLELYNNTITGCVSGIMQKTGPNQGNRYYNNFISNSYNNGIYLNEQFETGTTCYVHQNIILNAGAGISLEGVGVTRTVNNYQVYNNTIYGANTGIEGGVSTISFNRGVEFWNNLIVSPAGVYVKMYSGDAEPAYLDYNQYYGEVSSWKLNYSGDPITSFVTWLSDINTAGITDGDINSILTDPLFINAGGTAAVDYKRASYPTDGRGAPYEDVIGAYIDGTETIGVGAEEEYSHGLSCTGSFQ